MFWHFPYMLLGSSLASLGGSLEGQPKGAIWSDAMSPWGYSGLRPGRHKIPATAFREGDDSAGASSDSWIMPFLEVSPRRTPPAQMMSQISTVSHVWNGKHSLLCLHQASSGNCAQMRDAKLKSLKLAGWRFTPFTHLHAGKHRPRQGDIKTSISKHLHKLATKAAWQ